MAFGSGITGPPDTSGPQLITAGEVQQKYATKEEVQAAMNRANDAFAEA
jgi:hypothetical protein